MRRECERVGMGEMLMRVVMRSVRMSGRKSLIESAVRDVTHSRERIRVEKVEGDRLTQASVEW